MKPREVPPAPGRDALADAVVIGGSAGSLGAICRLLSRLPPDFPAAVAIVLHLPRHRRSKLATVIASFSPLPVREPDDKEPLAKATLYVAPADYHLLVDEGPVFSMSIDHPRHFSLPSIDALFESAARVLAPALAGVVLSGATADGAAGLRAICDSGGIGLVQSPAEAEVPPMPEAARRTCPMAEVMPALQLGSRLAALCRSVPEPEP